MVDVVRVSHPHFIWGKLWTDSVCVRSNLQLLHDKEKNEGHYPSM